MIKKAFTMAEIMIAMSIIGVISALVLPTVTNNTSSKQFLVTYKKAIAVINQAVDTNYAMSGWDFAGTRDNYMNAVSSILTSRLGAVSENASWSIKGDAGAGFKQSCMEKGYATQGEVCFDSNSVTVAVNSGQARAFTMKDGLASIIVLGEDFGTADQIPCRASGQRTLNPDGTYSAVANYCLGYIDVNGPKGPNRIVKCSNGVQNGGEIRDNISIGGCSMGANVSDVFPVIIYGDTLAPANAAALVAFQEKFSN